MENDDKIRLAAIPALLAMIKREEDYDKQCKMLFTVLCEIQKGESVEAKTHSLFPISQPIRIFQHNEPREEVPAMQGPSAETPSA